MRFPLPSVLTAFSPVKRQSAVEIVPRPAHAATEHAGEGRGLYAINAVQTDANSKPQPLPVGSSFVHVRNCFEEENVHGEIVLQALPSLSWSPRLLTKLLGKSAVANRELLL